MVRFRLALLLAVSLVLSLAVSCNRSKPAGESEGPSPAPSASPPGATSPATPTSPGPASPTPTTRTVPATPAVVLSTDGVGVARFGDDADTAIRALTAALGPPGKDSGWVNPHEQYGVCPADGIRALTWKDLQVLFAQGRTELRSDGKPHLFAFSYGTAGNAPTAAQPKLTTSKGIGLGSTLAELRRAYGPVETYDDEIAQATGFTIGEAPHLLFGLLSGPGPTARIEHLQGGVACGE